MSIKTRLIDYRDGELVCEGMLAWDDEVAGTRPGVLVAHTIRGRSPFEESKAMALAERGYAGFAIDVYGKDAIGADIEACRERMETLRSEREVLQQRLLLALQAMRDQPEVDASRAAAIGYCFGGLCVLDIARTGEPLAGVVSFHGLFDPPGNTEGNRIEARILALHGWDDPLATPDEAVALGQELSGMGADWQLHSYGNVRHAFTNPAADASTGVTVYNESADRRSWAAAQYFLSELFDT
ncbi:MAG: carboxymethylenebutenolidase [Gammaproteobacteria bacterium]|nr:carboxymethylenebutenolidase [Gammaproteobacteria bacterium]